MSDATLSVAEARSRFGALIRRAAHSHDRITVTDDGHTIAVPINSPYLTDLGDALAFQGHQSRSQRHGRVHLARRHRPTSRPDLRVTLGGSVVGRAHEPAYRERPRCTTRTIRRTSVTLPALDEPGLPRWRAAGDTSSSSTKQAPVSANTIWRTCTRPRALTGLRAQRTRLDQPRVASLEFTGYDLTALQWTVSKLSRGVFRDCKLLGAALEDVTPDNALYDNCKLAYAPSPASTPPDR